MLLVQNRDDEISMDKVPQELPDPPSEISNLLVTHSRQNKQEVQTLLGLYRQQLPKYVYQCEKALSQLQTHFQKRLQIANELLQGMESKESILLCQCRPGEDWIKNAGHFIKTIDGRVDETYFLTLTEDRQQGYLASVAGQFIAELQWKQALSPLLKLASLGSHVETPAFYLAMVVLTATSSPTLQQHLQASLWMESELQRAVFEEMTSRGIKMSEGLHAYKTDIEDLYNPCRRVLQMIHEIQDLNPKEKRVGQAVIQRQDLSIQRKEFQRQKKRELLVFCQKLDNDISLRLLLQAMTHNSIHPRTQEATGKMIECLHAFDWHNGSDNIPKCLKAYKLYSITLDHIRTKNYSQRLEKYLNCPLQPQQSFYTDFLQKILRRRAQQTEDIRALLQQNKHINPQKPQQFQEQCIPHEPKLKLRGSPQFQKQTQKNKRESHDVRQDWKRDSARNEFIREEVVLEGGIRLLGFQKRKEQLAEAVGLMTFYWQNQSGQEVKTVQGTGFLISGQVVVTAKHNFYHRSQKGRCSGCTIQLTTADDQDKIITYYSKPSNEWFESPQLDVGAVFLEQPVRHFRGNIRLATRNDVLQLQEREELMVMGYSLQNREPTKPDRVNQLSSVFMNIRQPYLQYSSNTLGGHSGSPVFAKSTGRQCLVVGVHVSRKIHGDVCRGVFLNDRIATQITAWAKQKLSQQIYLPQSFEALTNNINKEMESFREELLMVNRDANIPEVMEGLRQRILARRGDKEVMQEVSCKLLPVLQDKDIEEFYGRLYTKDGVEQARKELLRLGFQAPQKLPAYELAENRPYSHPEEEPSEILIIPKERETSTASEEEEEEEEEEGEMEEGDYEEDEESCVSQCSEDQQDQMEQQGFPEQKLVISYKPPEHIPRDSPYLSFLRLRLKATKATVSHLSSVESAFLGRQRVGRMGRWEVGVVAQRGWEDWQWVQCLRMNRGLLLVLIRDMVRMVMELQKRQIYLANLQKRNISLYCRHPVNYSTTSPEDCLQDLSQLRFKFVNFENALCLANEQTSKPAFTMIGLGRKLAGNQYMEMEPIVPLLDERGRDALERRFREEYSTSLSSQISYLGDYEGTRLLSAADSEYLQDLCRHQRYPEIVAFLDEAIEKMQ